MPRTAIVLFNLGGPDSPAAIQPFLNNLFNDPAIIGLPWPLRPLLASVISHRRQKEAKRIYDRIGGFSPLLENTRQQAQALEAALGDGDIRVFIAMRYWHPMSEDTALEVAAFDPGRILLLPLYPQFSTTTTGSSLVAWRRAWRRHGRGTPTQTVCCWPRQAGLVETHAGLLRDALADAGDSSVRILFSAHGLPEAIIRKGDPYQWQIEETAAAIAAAANLDDWRVAYQSRVGPLTWIGPSIEEEIERAAQDDLGVVVVPVAFVSEHSETLVELDIQYRELAEAAGCRPYIRVAAPGCDARFIAALADLARRALEDPRGGPASACGGRLCPAGHRKCPAAS